MNSVLIFILTLTIYSVVGVVNALYWNQFQNLRSVLDVNELNKGSVYVKVGPELWVQAVLTGAAELVTEFFPRES